MTEDATIADPEPFRPPRLTSEGELEFDRENPEQTIKDLIQMHLIYQEPTVRPSDLQMQSRKQNRQIMKPDINFFAPFFESIALRYGAQVDLNVDDLAGWRIVLLFYPKNHLKENIDIIKSYAQYREIFQKMNTQVVFCSPDSFHELRSLGHQFAEENGKDYLQQIILLTDQFNQVGHKYAVQREEDNDFIEAMYIINEYGKLKYSSLVNEQNNVSEQNDMSVKKAINELLIIRNVNQW